MCGVSIPIRVAPIEDDDIANRLDQFRRMLIAERLAQTPFFSLASSRDAQLDQFVIRERAVDFSMQIFAESLLSYDDYWLQLLPMSLGTQDFNLLSGQWHWGGRIEKRVMVAQS